MNPLLTLEHVGFAYHQAEGETPALSDISFTLEAGHFWPSWDPAAVENPRCSR